MSKYFCTCDAAQKGQEIYCGTCVGHEKHLNGVYKHREHDTDREVCRAVYLEAKKVALWLCPPMPLTTAFHFQ